MRFISEALQSDGHPVINALGVTRVRGGFQCELVYVNPTPGVDDEHTPLPAGPVQVQFWASPDSDPIPASINWPALTTGVPLGARTHENVFFTEENNEQNQNGSEDEA